MRELDILNDFLNGTLSGTVYLKQPKGLVDEQRPSYVCKLHKSIYGLKQAPRASFQWLISFLLKNGFTDSHTDSSLFICTQDADVRLVYVDDLIITGSNPSLLDSMVSKLSNAFKLRDLGSLIYFLGIEVHHQNGGLFVDSTEVSLLSSC